MLITICKITRESIEAIKEHFKDEVTQEDVALLAKLKNKFGIL
jgi:hypothetical protein